MDVDSERELPAGRNGFSKSFGILAVLTCIFIVNNERGNNLFNQEELGVEERERVKLHIKSTVDLDN